MISRLFCLLATLAALMASPALAQVSTSQVSVTPNAAQYTAAYCLGGVLNVPNLVRSGGSANGTIIVDVDIVDTTGSDVSIDLFVFSQAPTGTYTDHAACTIAAADQAYLKGVIPGSTFTCAKDSAGSTGICRATPALSVTQTAGTTSAPILPTSTSLWFVPIIRGTPTYGSGQTLYFNITAMPQ
jgi:hypothetical protein